jgi:hypothetical protein
MTRRCKYTEPSANRLINYTRPINSNQSVGLHGHLYTNVRTFIDFTGGSRHLLERYLLSQHASATIARTNTRF